MTESGLIQTGIYGLDQIFLGGILKGNVILVEGAPGVGKTLLGVEFVYRGVTEHNEPGVIVVFETSPKKLIRDATGFGWNLDELQQRNKLKIIFTSPKVLDQELRSPDSLLLETAAPPPSQRYGKVFVGPIDAARGLSFDAVFVPGLAEKMFPRKIVEEPILLDGIRKLVEGDLATNQSRLERERLALARFVQAAARPD